MIGKFSKGSNFNSLSQYLTFCGRAEKLEFVNLSSHDPDSAADEMAIQASLSGRCKKPVGHLILAYSDDAEVKNDHMIEDAKTVLADIGAGERQAMIAVHRDKDHPHLHIMFNRVAADGRALSDSNSFLKIEKSLRRIESERGYKPVLGRHADLPQPKPGQCIRKKGPKAKADPRQHPVPSGVLQAFENARNQEDLNGRLEKNGWKLEIFARRGKNGSNRPASRLIGPEGQTVAPSSIDYRYSAGQLQKHWLDGVDLPKAVTLAMQKARTRRELDRLLKKQGWRLEEVQKNSRKGGRLVGPNGQKVAASRAGSGCSLGALKARFGKCNRMRASRKAVARSAAQTVKISAKSVMKTVKMGPRF